MTIDEAIKWLKVEASYIEEDIGNGKEILEAYDMAIEALEQLQEKPEYIDIWNVGAILRNVPEQPDICKIYGGVCGYPIEACSECPKHEGWRPSKEQTRWISVSERLPEENGDYLVTFKLSFMNFIEVCTFNKAGWDKGGYDEVIAWMPLPEVYRGGESDAK